jgi:hypothetical protein
MQNMRIRLKDRRYTVRYADRKCAYKRNIEARLPNHFCIGKAISITYSTLGLQPSLSSMQSTCAILHYYLWPVWLYRVFPRYLTNGTIFGKTLLNVKCVLIFSAKSVRNNSDSQKNSARYHNECTQVFM